MLWQSRGECVMSGTKILIDTNIAINLLKGNNRVGHLLQDREAYVSFMRTGIAGLSGDNH